MNKTAFKVTPSTSSLSLQRRQISLVIPTRNAGPSLSSLLHSVKYQTIRPMEIIIIDSESKDATRHIAETAGCNVYKIKEKEFSHGGTRNFGASVAKGNIIVFMTQDAQLADTNSLDFITKYFSDNAVGAVCGRQIPQKDATPLAAHIRFFNYPINPCIKTKNNILKMGIKTPFISNSFAAYRKSLFDELGGFSDSLIFGEDMYFAAKIILSGYSVAYAGDACAFHSHNYSVLEEFCRYFDIGVLHARETWIQESFGSTNGEGLRFFRSELSYAYKYGFYWVIRSVLSCCLKFIGYKVGGFESRLPNICKYWFSMNKNYWIKKQ